MDVPVFATGFYEQFGYDRPVYTLSFDLLLIGPTGDFFSKTGFIQANHENADEALRSGGVVVVFPGGDYDVYRPTTARNKIDFGGRTGYVKAALNAGVPIVPMVGIGGQESQMYLTRGTEVAKLLAPRQAVARQDPAGVVSASRSACRRCSRSTCRCPPRSSCRCCEPIDIAAEFGEDPDVDEVDAHVRRVMQTALDELAERAPAPGARLSHDRHLGVDRHRRGTSAGVATTMARAG